jgi:glutamate---cysteine ligase / carboxylate-amine ligase
MVASRGSRARLLVIAGGRYDADHVQIPSVARSRVPTARGHRKLPLWAHWNAGLEQRYTLGAEEEVMLLRPGDWSLAEISDTVIAGLPNDLSEHVAPETHAGVLELVTGVHADVRGAVAELNRLRDRFGRELDTMGLSAAAAGTHPLVTRADGQVSRSPRYRHVGESMRVLARREPTMALHVHIGIPDPEEAVRVLNGLRRAAPVLLALSANSPYWQGRDSGFASVRTVIFQAFPRTGLPRRFDDYADYVEAVDPLIASEAVPDPSFLWWDVRLQPALGTVEVRIMDAQSTLRHIGPLIALIQSLAHLELEGEPTATTPGPEVLAENRFLAARDGMAARLIAPQRNDHLTPVREILGSLVAECQPHALALGCLDALDRVERASFADGAESQRAVAARGGRLEDLVAGLAAQFRPRIGHVADQPDLTAYPSTTERGG